MKLLQNKIEDSIIKEEIDKIEHDIYAETIKELVEKKIENDLILKNKVKYLEKNLKLIDNNFMF